MSRLLVATLLGVLATGSRAAATPPAATIGIDERLGAPLPLDATFRDGAGSRVTLQALVAGSSPTLLVLAYYRCPILCDLVLAGLAQSEEVAATGAHVLAISFDPRDKPEDARLKEMSLLSGRPARERSGWRVVVDDDGSARRVADAVGFRYAFDPTTGQYAHPAAVIVLTPKGTVAQYLYGVRFDAATIGAALTAAGAGRSTPTVSRLFLVCAQYVSALARHQAFINGFLRVGGGLAFVGFGTALVWLVRRRSERSGA
jgi:protein SCO1/2